MVFKRLFKVNIEKLTELGDIPSLQQALSDPDIGIRKKAAVSLTTFGAGGIIPLLSALESMEDYPRRTILAHLSEGKFSRNSPLILLMTHASPNVRCMISQDLALIEKPNFTDLTEALMDPVPEQRICAIQLLSGRGHSAVPKILPFLNDPESEVGKATAIALKELKWKGEDPAMLLRYYLYLNEWSELARLKQYAVPALRVAMKSVDPSVRRDAVRTMGKIRDPNALAEIIALLSDPDSIVRAAAAEALGETGDQRTIPYLIRSLEDTSHQVQMESAWSLDRLGWRAEHERDRIRYLVAKEQWNDLAAMGKVAIQSLIQALREEQSGVRIGATEALMKIGQPAFEALSVASSSGDPVLQTAARQTLTFMEKKKNDEQKRKPARNESDIYEKELEDSRLARKRAETHLKRKQSSSHRVHQSSQSDPARTIGKNVGEKGEMSIQEIFSRGQVDIKKITKTMPGSTRQEITSVPDTSSAEEINLALKKLHADSGLEQGIASPGLRKTEPVPSIDDRLRNQVRPDAAIPVAQTPQINATDQELSQPPVEIDNQCGFSGKTENGPTTLDQILVSLKNPNEQVRAAAIEVLKSLGTSSVDYIISALSDTSPVVRETAAEALGDLEDERGVLPLIEQLRDPSYEVKIAVLRGLGKLNDLRALPALIHCFSDEYYVVRHAASDATAQFGDEGIPQLVIAFEQVDDLTRQLIAVRTLGKIGDERIIGVLMKRIGEQIPELRHAVAVALGSIGEPAIDPLVRVLSRGSRSERLGALDALSTIISDRVEGVLSHALNDPDPEVREKAGYALKKRNALKLWSRAWAEQLHRETALSAQPKDPAYGESRSRAEANREISGLIVALKANDRQAQIASAFKLIVLGRPAVEGLLNVLKTEDPVTMKAVSEVIGEMRDVAVDPLMDALGDNSKMVRIIAARNLGRIGNLKSFERLAEAFQRDMDPEVRAVVAEALGYLGDPRAIDYLAAGLHDRNDQVQETSARSLGYIGDYRAVEPLIRALNDTDERIRRAALKALKDPDGSLNAHLVNALRYGDRGVTAGAADALDRIGWKPSTMEETVYYCIAKERWGELVKTGTVALPYLDHLLDDPQVDMRIEAVKTIAHIGKGEAIPLLIRALKDPHFLIRRRAEQALIDIGPSARDALMLLSKAGIPEYEQLIKKIDERQGKRSGNLSGQMQ